MVMPFETPTFKILIGHAPIFIHRSAVLILLTVVPLPPQSPEWCLAPFDPEGILRLDNDLLYHVPSFSLQLLIVIIKLNFFGSLMAVLTCLVGLHFGHIRLHYEGEMHRVVLWSMSSFTLLISGFGLQVLGIPFSKPLYTLSYMCITAGASGLFLTIIFYMDRRKP
ncbi:hypothetical protein F3Y22_tig00110549pilonHSYRG00002 [Hibiscus syriacus]|uniref:Uncharacterized protein n=1 Tax=Hibiscus syriacus TaxID=106335 RepID=A0A6A3A905_HIBSY|nr:hypothetical protein F3Y22_tig00110549pilonHSYRG00002 [Hibiscus syriacus]